MPTWQSHTIQANGLTLHYTRQDTHMGGNKPPLLLTHGFSDDGLCWTPVAERLAADYDVIMLDARGHGRSDGPEEGYGPLEHAADVAGVIAGLGLEKPLLLGHSMGASTALAFAGTYSDLPGAILLEDPPLRWLDAAHAAPPANRRLRFGSWIVDVKRKTKEELIAVGREQSPTWAEAELGPWAESKLRLSFNVLTADQAAPIDWMATAKAITCPTLLITADVERGAIVSPEQATALQSLVPQVQTIHIAQAGHNIRREQFTAYMAAVQEFLAGFTQ